MRQKRGGQTGLIDTFQPASTCTTLHSAPYNTGCQVAETLMSSCLNPYAKLQKKPMPSSKLPQLERQQLQCREHGMQRTCI
jgi:hypothetical protein